MDELIKLDQVNEIVFNISHEDELPLSIGEGVLVLAGGSIDETEFNLAYVRQADLISNVLNGNKVYEYSPEEMESMESTLINITRGGK